MGCGEGVGMTVGCTVSSATTVSGDPAVDIVATDGDCGIVTVDWRVATTVVGDPAVDVVGRDGDGGIAVVG